MSSLLSRSLMVAGAALALLAPAASARAQGRPTPDQVRVLLQTRPDLVKKLQERLAQSGMTRDQIRARLRAEGYPEDLLDAYYPGSTTAAPAEVDQSVFSAVEALGITDAEASDSLRAIAGLPPRGAGAPSDQEQHDLAAARTAAIRRLEGDTIRLIPRAPDDERLPDTLHLRRTRGDTLALLADVSGDDDALAVFGLDVFQQGGSQFDANLAGSVDPSYRLGPGDQLVLVLTGDIEASYSLDVTRQGFVVIPQVGEVNVANLTLGQLEEVLYTRLGRVYSGVRRGAGATTHFSISPARLRTNQVYVIGDVAHPGSYRVSAAGTALTALYAAGGPTAIGSLRQVEIRRGGRVVDVLDVYDYLLRGDASHDPRLENGDVVFVPVHGARVHVTGQVLRPAIYEMKSGETLADAVQAAGGFRADAERGRVQIDRIIPPARREGTGRDRMTIDVSVGPSANGSALPLENGDVVRVFAVSRAVRRRAAVRGNVWSPGTIGFEPGMRLSDALRLAGGLKPNTYLGRVLVSRLLADSTRVQLHAALRDTTGTVVNDFTLADDDEIRVFATSEFRASRFVAITGTVRRSGRYPYRDGMTMRDLIMLAGGLREGASLQAAEIARLPESRDKGQLARTLRVALDSSYVFDAPPSTQIVPVGLAAEPHANDVPLEPYDNVLILREPGWELQRTVTLAGEVRYPGVYSLRAKSDRLSDVLARAGGLTSEGYSDGVVFVRKRGNVGRIGIDLARVLRNESDRDNLALQDGDSIYIPTYSGTVNVTGAVNSPVTVAYVPGKSIDYYIAAAGGLAPKAELSGAYVTQPNGKVESRKRHALLPDSKPKPRAGSEVTVPFKDPSQRSDYTALVTAGVQIMASLVALVAILRR